MIKTIVKNKINNNECIVRINTKAKYNITVSKEKNILYIDFKKEPTKEELQKTLKQIVEK